MRAVYVARGVLDYRVPVLSQLNKLCGGELRVLYAGDYVPARVAGKLAANLGDQAVALRGETRFGPELREYHGFANKTFRLSYQPGLLTEIDRARPDVIIGEGFFQWTAAAILRRIRKGTPLVISYERTAHTDRNAQRFRRVYWRAVMPLVDAMACNGSLSSQHAVSLGMAPDRITTGQMAADTDGLTRTIADLSDVDRLRIRERWGAPALVFLYAGKLNVPKGVWEMLRAWEQLPTEVAASSALVLVGDGPERPRLERHSRAAELSNVFFEGVVDYDEMARLYGCADVLLMPTLEDNWSLVVAEAMACGLPILCSRYNGCYPELIAEGENGLVFDPLSLQGTVDALIRAYSRSREFSAMGERSREIVADYSPARAAAAIFAACEIAAGHRKRRRK